MVRVIGTAYPRPAPACGPGSRMVRVLGWPAPVVDAGAPPGSGAAWSMPVLRRGPGSGVVNAGGRPGSGERRGALGAGGQIRARGGFGRTPPLPERGGLDPGPQDARVIGTAYPRPAPACGPGSRMVRVIGWSAPVVNAGAPPGPGAAWSMPVLRRGLGRRGRCRCSAGVRGGVVNAGAPPGSGERRGQCRWSAGVRGAAWRARSRRANSRAGGIREDASPARARRSGPGSARRACDWDGLPAVRSRVWTRVQNGACSWVAGAGGQCRCSAGARGGMLDVGDQPWPGAAASMPVLTSPQNHPALEHPPPRRTPPSRAKNPPARKATPRRKAPPRYPLNASAQRSSTRPRPGGCRA